MSSELINQVEDRAKEGLELMTNTATQKGFQLFGTWVQELAFSQRWFVEWRVKNLMAIEENFSSVVDTLNLTDDQRNNIANKFGIAWIESAALEDDPTLQGMWAKLLSQACLDNTGGRESIILSTC